MPSREGTESKEADNFRFLESLHYSTKNTVKIDKISSGVVGLPRNPKINSLSSVTLFLRTVFGTFGSQKSQNWYDECPKRDLCDNFM